MSYSNVGINPDGTCTCDCNDEETLMEYNILSSRHICPKCGCYIDDKDIHELVDRGPLGGMKHGNR